MNLNLNPDPDQAQERQDQEIQSFTLVGRGGWPVAVLWLLAFLLGFFNFSLFYETVHGVKGVITGTVALAVEGTALYCVLNYSRSIEQHKEVLGIWGKRFFTFSLVHATASFIHTAGFDILNKPIYFYSHVIAFPAMVVLLTVGVNKIIMSHWSGKILKDLADSKIVSLRNRADALMKQSGMRDGHQIATLRAMIFAELTDLQSKLIPVIRRFIGVREERDRMVRDIPDPLLRDQMQRSMLDLFQEKPVKKTKKPVELGESQEPLDFSLPDPDALPLKNGTVKHP